MPSRKNSPRQWNDSICCESSERAKEEQQKRWKAFVAVRGPQKELDPRIFKIAKNHEVVGDKFPYLHYGVLVPRESLHTYIARHKIKVPKPALPGSSEPYSLLSARSAVAKHLRPKCGMELRWIRPFEEDDDKHYVIAMDDTLYLDQRYTDPGQWEKSVASAVSVLREEFNLGNQQPMWWWDSICNIGYCCPIEDYNPPQVNAERRMQTEPLSYDSDSSDDEPELESGSDTETEDPWYDS